MSDEQRAEYSWNQCISDQMDKFDDQKTANAICDAIKAGKDTMTKPSDEEYSALLKKLGIAEPERSAEHLACYARAYVITRAAPDLPEDAPVRFVASTEGVKRDGLDLKVQDWSLDNYLRHPVILWAHDYESRLPIGTGTPSFEGSNLMIDVAFDRDDEFAQQVRAKALKGMVAGSVGWNDLKDGKRDLMEFSIVPVPADPLALPARARAAMRSLAREIDRAFGVESGAVEKSPSVSADGQRYGAIMSARDMEQLEQAIGILQKLLGRAKHESEEAKAEEKKTDAKKGDEADEDERQALPLAKILETLTRLGG